jgi:TetR/AcrR family transcriptional repressor of nem operon
LFNSKGFSEVSIGEIMTHAGLTHGGFYRHFSGKEAVYAESVRHFMCKKAPDPWQAGQAASGAGKTPAQRIVNAYFSRDHFDERECCCPLLGMASDVSRGGEAVKAAYREVAEKLVRVFAAHLAEPQARERALALVALCVGGMVVARSVDDPGLADDFRSAAYKQVLRTAGWDGDQDRVVVTAGPV